MTRSTHAWIAALALGLLSAGLAVGTLRAESIESTSPLEQYECPGDIADLRAALVEATERHDGAAAAALFEPDALVDGPGFSARGPEEIERFFAGSGLGSLEIEVEGCSKKDDFALEYGRWRVTDPGTGTRGWVELFVSYGLHDERWLFDSLLSLDAPDEEGSEEGSVDASSEPAADDEAGSS